MNSKLGRQHTKALPAASLCPFMSFLPVKTPNPWCEWCDVWRLATSPGSTSPTLLEQWCGFFYVPQEPDKCKCCVTGPTGFSSSSEKTRNSNCLQMSLQRQHFLLSYLKTLSVGPSGDWTVYPRSKGSVLPRGSKGHGESQRVSEWVRAQNLLDLKSATP